MIRIGIVGFDTSHSVQFTKRINHVGIPEDQWVEGARIVSGYPGGPTSFADEELISERTQQIRGLGVEIADSPQDIIEEVDAVLLEVQEGALHYQDVKKFVEAGLPVFIDKPFACSTHQAKQIAELARSNNVPIFSSSSLRYALEVESAKAAKDIGSFLTVDTYSPANLNPKNPGLFNYGIHGVEMLYSLMGAGCSSVICIWNEKWEKVFARWKNGAAATFTGLRTGEHTYGFTVFGEKRTFFRKIDTAYIYRELLKKIIEMFETGKPPLPIEETVEIIAFLEAALKSANSGGTEERLII